MQNSDTDIRRSPVGEDSLGRGKSVIKLGIKVERACLVRTDYCREEERMQSVATAWLSQAGVEAPRCSTGRVQWQTWGSWEDWEEPLWRP